MMGIDKIIKKAVKNILNRYKKRHAKC